MTQNTFWTEGEDQSLRRMYADGVRVVEIARALGRTKNMVIGRANRLGLAHTVPHPSCPHSDATRARWGARKKEFARRWANGETYGEIAAAMGYASYSSASAMRRRFGLPRRTKRRA